MAQTSAELANALTQPTCYIAMPYKLRSFAVRDAIVSAAGEAGYRIATISYAGGEKGAGEFDSGLSAVAASDCIIADMSSANANVNFELGVARAMGKGILLVTDEQGLEDAPFEIRGFKALTYSVSQAGLVQFQRAIERALRDIRYMPATRAAASGLQSLPFYVDWDSLEPSETENLCRELLSQMGFRRLDWGKVTPEIDLIAELPKNDPDGFEYRELWLVAMGLRSPLEMLIEMASEDADFFLHRLLRYSDRFSHSRERTYETSYTLLIVLTRKAGYAEQLEHLRERFEKRSYTSRSGSGLRVRIWDQDYLTMLIHRTPAIGYKYFSVEGRIRSTTRKSYEQLYEENSTLLARQVALNQSLEDEKNKRIRAERDAVWKEISFAAAHKIGNPIFAIETDIEPLERRIVDGRTAEAREVVKNISSSVEKAKAFVEQFKSLAKAQDIKLAPTLLKPILEKACAEANRASVQCTVTCADDLQVVADPDRLAECFDELVTNAIHWFGKGEKSIKIEASSPAPQPLPDSLDSSHPYVLIHFTDNGPGIPTGEKSKIFDAFFTNRGHGTGLGLALVRRIIDGHNGGIFEVGALGRGADFEIFLPTAQVVSKTAERRRKKPAIATPKEA